MTWLLVICWLKCFMNEGFRGNWAKHCKKYLKFMVKKTGKCYFNTVKKLLFKKKKCNPNLDGKSNVFYLEKSI